MKKIILTGAFNYTKDQLDAIKSLGYHIIFVQNEQESVHFEVSDIEGIVCNSFFLYNDITKFHNLKYIQLTSAGLDRVPLDDIKKNNISLFNAQGVYSIPIAEWVVLKILEIYNQSRFFYQNQKNKQWIKHRDLLELYDKKVCIIGYGNIGNEIARRLKGFGVYIIGCDIVNKDSVLLDEFILIDKVNQIIPRCDIIITTLPLTQETKHFINQSRINLMKDNSVLVNVSRGEIISEVDLIKALDDKKFLGVALDVFEKEPLDISSPLWDYENVIITPHNSFVSDNINKRLFEVIYNNLRVSVVANSN